MGSSRRTARIIAAIARVGAGSVHPGVLLASRARRTEPAGTIHLTRATDWLLAANDNVPEKLGFSLGYFADEDRWQSAYVETTGYIVPTLFRVAEASAHRRGEIWDAVTRSAEWLTNIQFRDGSYGNPIHYLPTVFDTGQVLFGLIAAHKQLHGESYLDAAVRAGDWLCTVQDSNGGWTRGAYGGEAHSYYSEVSWALLLLWKLTGRDSYRATAIRNLEWVVSQQAPNGFFCRSGFEIGKPAVLHTIAYAIQGVLESGFLLEDSALEGSARIAAGKLARLQEDAGILYGSYDDEWDAGTTSRCLTGLAQMGVVWRRLAKGTSQPLMDRAADRVLAYLASQQLVDSPYEGLRGGLMGSAPVWGRYFPFRVPNWGVKFFIDLLLLQ
jgi:prenyltransferase beta subunit